MGKLNDKMKDKKKKEKEESTEDILEYYSKFKSDKKKAKKTVKEIQENSSSSDFLKIPDGETVIRILPSKNLESDDSYKLQTTHSIEYYKDGKKSYANINCKGNEDCFGCQAIMFLKKQNNKEAKELIQKIKARTRYLFAVLVRETGKVGIYSAPQTVAQTIIGGISHGEPFDIYKGQDFLIIKNSKASSPMQFYAGSNYIPKISKLVPSGISKDMDKDEKAEKKAAAEKKMAAILKQIPDLSAIVKEDSEEKIEKFKEILEMIIGSKSFRKLEALIDGDIDEEDLDKMESEAASMDDEELYDEENEESDDDDDLDDEEEDEE